MDYDVNAFSSDEEAGRPRIIRHRPNYFEELDQEDFFCRFRLSKNTVENILEQIEDTISHPTDWNDALTPMQQLLLTLNFYSNGSFLRTTGDFCGVSKSTSSRVVKRVSVALANLLPIYIRMPEGDEINEIRQQFYNIARFPRCIGAIDCTHIKIQSPGGANAETFRNRKNFFSFNVQTISDPNLKIRDIVARWPGSSHDAHIFRNSNICASFEQGHFGEHVLLGDSGYAIKNYLIKPLAHVTNAAEQLFNESQIRTRNVVERQYGVWKRRFPSLAMGLRVKLETVQPIIVATAVLHNIACDANENDPPVHQEQERAIRFANNVNAPNMDELLDNRLNPNNRRRYNLINNYFAQL
ncbi:putative nuclease HARBI1 [Diabrotica virgifera virgifera]|uniref:Nuclease HARBI1 n=1 Tax=Diabrotica virgifera virgifera TaxID=50390 RepID=A0A6P7GUX6_DIAVI|nr:putative nuclease HARBI1 [Diabrotica virgifera virgifera]